MIPQPHSGVTDPGPDAGREVVTPKRENGPIHAQTANDNCVRHLVRGFINLDEDSSIFCVAQVYQAPSYGDGCAVEGEIPRFTRGERDGPRTGRKLPLHCRNGVDVYPSLLKALQNFDTRAWGVRGEGWPPICRSSRCF